MKMGLKKLATVKEIKRHYTRTLSPQVDEECLAIHGSLRGVNFTSNVPLA
jgi:hypothetical protein